MTNQTIEKITASNTRFYRALANADLTMMDRVWLHSDDVSCLHPGWSLLRGWKDVRSSWQGIFQNQGKSRIWPSDVEVFVSGDMAWLLCIENIDIGEQDKFVDVMIQTQATNIFRLQAGNWRMVHHHASQNPLVPRDNLSDIGPQLSIN